MHLPLHLLQIYICRRFYLPLSAVTQHYRRMILVATNNARDDTSVPLSHAPNFSALLRIRVNRYACDRDQQSGFGTTIEMQTIRDQLLVRWLLWWAVLLDSTQHIWRSCCRSCKFLLLLLLLLSCCWSCRFLLLRRCPDLRCQKSWRWVNVLYTVVYSTAIYQYNTVT